MFARVVSVQVDLDKLDAAVEEFERIITTQVKPQKGWVGVYLLVDRNTRKSMAIGLYDSEEAARAVAESGVLQDVFTKLSEFMDGTPVIESYEVAAQVQ